METRLFENPSTITEDFLEFCNSTCRICLKRSHELWDLFNDADISHKIMTVAAVQIQKDDGLPSMICLECKHLVDISYNLKFQIERTDHDFRQLLLIKQTSSTSNDVTIDSILPCLIPNDKNIVDSTIDDFIQDNEAIFNIAENRNEILETQSLSFDNPSVFNNLITDQIVIEGKIPDIYPLENHVVDQKEEFADAHSSQHQYAKKSKKYTCGTCDKKFNSKRRLIKHTAKCIYKKCTDNVKCKSEFIENKDVKIEEKYTESLSSEEDVNPLDNLGIICEQCGKTFVSERNLKRHLLVHSGLKYTCTICDKDFSRPDKLREHEQLKHQDSTETDSDSTEETKGGIKKIKDKNRKPHRCDLCPKSFAHEQSLNNHVEKHKKKPNPTKRFLCEICSKCFAQSGSLVAHMRTHTGVKPYVCDICNRAFTKSTYLQLHLRTHSGEKPYICQYCSQAFARANTLARHITMHTGEAKYKCTICFKAFRRLTSLNEHNYVHTGQKPYVCKFCDKRYNNAGSLYAHSKKCKMALSLKSPADNSSKQEEDTTVNAKENIEDSLSIIQQLPMPEMLVNNSNSYKEITENAIDTFCGEESDIFSGVDSKTFKTPYYELYQGIQ